MKIYISTPAASETGKTQVEVIARVEELKSRLMEKYSHEGVSHLDNPIRGKFNERVGGNVALLMDCDGILLDNIKHQNRVCSMEEAVARQLSQWKKPFVFYHTKEEFDIVIERYIV